MNPKFFALLTANPTAAEVKLDAGKVKQGDILKVTTEVKLSNDE